MRLKKAISVFVAYVLMSTCLCAGLAGCSEPSPQSDGQADQQAAFNVVRIGTMPTEDILPMWAAWDEDLFSEAGIDAQIITFDSAQALSAAITAGEVDMAMVDIMRAVKLSESGVSVVLEWVTLGTDASQGRFGVLAPADAPYSTLQELAQQAAEDPDSLAAEGVGVAANTVPEYVFDKLCEQAGLEEGSVPTQEVASLPERFSLMASGRLAGAALPGSLLELGEANGMKLLADDASADGANISQSIMVATEAFAQADPETVIKVAEVWDAAASRINEDPTAYISLLADTANLNDTIADSYSISTYPMALNGTELAHPAAECVIEQIEWMRNKGYSSHNVEYSETTGELAVDA